jgi:hypothetical protein
MIISTLNGLEILGPPKNYNGSTSMFIVSTIVVVKAFNNQWSLNQFITHTHITRFKQKVIIFAIAHTWA